MSNLEWDAALIEIEAARHHLVREAGIEKVTDFNIFTKGAHCWILYGWGLNFIYA